MSEFEAFWHYPLFRTTTGIELTVSQIVLTVLVVVLGLILSWYLKRLLGRQLQKSNVDPNAGLIIQRIFFYSVLILLFITALGMLRIPVTALAFISGAVAIGVGFGAQAVINNLISGWILMSERPVRIGDFVEIDDNRGVVESIGNRSTRIRRVDGVHLLVPNSQMLERVVINWTLVDRKFRSSVRLGVAYGSPVRLVEQLLYQAAGEQEEVLPEPKPFVVFDDFGESALVFEVIFWCQARGERDLRMVRSDIRFRVEELFREHGIVIAFPQRDVHVHAKAPFEIATRAAVDAPSSAGDPS